MLRHARRVDGKDLAPPHLIRQPDLDLHLQPPGPEQRVVQHVFPVGHADE